MEKEKLKEGIIYVPYLLVTSSTSINGETVWYKNKFKNFLLKIKFFFIKPKHKKFYVNKPINAKYYESFKIKGDE